MGMRSIKDSQRIIQSEDQAVVLESSVPSVPRGYDNVAYLGLELVVGHLMAVVGFLKGELGIYIFKA